MNHLRQHHLSEEQIYQYSFADADLAEESAVHLAGCWQCQQQVQQLQTLAQAMTVTKLSSVKAATRHAYYQLFEQVQTNPSLFTRSIQSIKAQLQWDSRQQPALQGVRGSGSPTYRLLYSSEVADVELLVEVRNGNRRIEGEIIPVSEGSLQLPALLQLSSHPTGNPLYEVESGANGRFQIESLTPGDYSFTLLPRKGVHVAIERLGLT